MPEKETNRSRDRHVTPWPSERIARQTRVLRAYRRAVRLIGVAIGIQFAACGTRPPIVISDERCGPIDGTTSLTPEFLERAFGGDVTRDDGGYRVDRGERQLLVARPDERGKVCEVHVFSRTAEVRGKPWRVRKHFSGGEQLTDCECWRDQMTCWKRGEHVAVAFTVECGSFDGRDPDQRRALNGHNVYNIVWSPEPLGEHLDFDRCRNVSYDGDDDDDTNVTTR
jgi:hypothetical protein